MGKGLTLLTLIIIREVVFISVLCINYAFTFEWGSPGVWGDIVIGGAFGCAIAYLWANRCTRGLKRDYIKEKKPEM